MNRQRPFTFCLLVGVLAVLVGCVGEAPPVAKSPDKNEAKVQFTNVLGGTYSLPGPGDCKAVVLLFWGHDCPISNAYAPEITRLCKEFSPKGIAFCVVYADADLTAEEAHKHAKDYGCTCPAILDSKMSLALKVGATIKPEAAVLSPKGELLYLGRIDDIYADFGKRRSQPTCRELKDALDAILAGKAITVARTKAIGCYIDFPEKKK